MKNLLLPLLLVLVTFNLFGQVPAAPGNGIYGLIANQYQVGPTAQGTTLAKITLQNTTLTKFTATKLS